MQNAAIFRPVLSTLLHRPSTLSETTTRLWDSGQALLDYIYLIKLRTFKEAFSLDGHILNNAFM